MSLDESTQSQWDKRYAFDTKAVAAEQKRYHALYLEDTLAQILEYWKPKKGQVYLEIGCGECFLGLELAKRYGVRVIGVDYSKKAIQVAKELFRRAKIKNCEFLVGDISNMPLKNESVHFIYGGGVIEHNHDQRPLLKEIYRVLRYGGVSFNTVPKLNIGALTYRQVWGNIPNIPIARQLFEFIHITMLRQKFMRFGYELSFLPTTLYDLHADTGFRYITVKDFKVTLVLEYIPFPLLRKVMEKVVSATPVLRPMLKAIAIK